MQSLKLYVSGTLNLFPGNVHVESIECCLFHLQIVSGIYPLFFIVSVINLVHSLSILLWW